MIFWTADATLNYCVKMKTNNINLSDGKTLMKILDN